jgi:hypothetical protein
VSSMVQADLPRARGAVASQYRWLAPAGLVILAFAWPLFVFTGSQVSYLVSIAAACCTAAALAAARRGLVVGYIAGLLALVGPEVNGQLGNGRAPLGSLRVLDAATATAAAAVLLVGWRSRGQVIPRLRHLGALAVLNVLVLGYATVRWGMEGHRVDSFLRTDLRLILLAALLWLIVTRCTRGGARAILWGVVVVGLLAACKAAAIHLSGVYAIGSFDRLQASNYYVSGHPRTILIGGDTLMILVPATTVLLARATQRLNVRIALLVCALTCLSALGLSATRTSVLVALGLILMAVAATLALDRPHLSGRAIAHASLLAALIIVVALLGGAASRLTHADAPHVGLNFRKDEVNTFLRAPATTKYLGQGLGGRFLGKDVNGKPVLSGWAHELPVWIALKTGVFGLVCAALAIAVIARRVTDRFRHGGDQTQILVGTIFVLGLLIMSMTLDRLALPEGILPFIIGVFLSSSAARPSIRSTTA